MDLQGLVRQEGLSGAGGARAGGRLLVFHRRAASVRLLPVHALLAGEPLLLGGGVFRRQRIGVEALSGPPPDDLLAVVLLDDV